MALLLEATREPNLFCSDWLIVCDLINQLWLDVWLQRGKKGGIGNLCCYEAPTEEEMEC